MRILLLIRSLGRGGAERQLVLLANGLAARGHTVGVATFYPSEDRSGELASSVTCFDLGKRGRWDILGFLRRYLVICREFNPEIVHGYMPAANLVAAVGRYFIPAKIVWGIRATQMPHHLYEYGWLSAVIDRFAAYTWSNADLIICNSEAGQRWCHSQGLPRHKTLAIANGIPPYRLDVEQERARVRAAFRISEAAQVIGYIGRLDPVKNIELLIEAFGVLRAKKIDCYLIIAGDGSAAYTERLCAAALRAGGASRVIILPGAQIDSALAAFDVGASSSLSEGFSNTIAEMMSAGVPCVVTDVGDSARIVGDTGVAVPSGAADEFAAALLTLLTEEPVRASQRRLAARARIESEFTITKLIERTEAALAALLR